MQHPAARTARSLRMPYMSLRPLLSHFADDPNAPRYAREGGRAFVSASYRPVVVGALLDGVDGPMAGKPALVVAADDRQARDLAADLRQWLAPRPVRFYPSRGGAHDAPLPPPPRPPRPRRPPRSASAAPRSTRGWRSPTMPPSRRSSSSPPSR